MILSLSNRLLSTTRHLVSGWLRELLRVDRAGRDSKAACEPFQFGGRRRLTPVSRRFGFDRGLCIDRHYIERFLADHSADIRGRVLEFADATYTRRFGGRQVTHSDVMHAVEGNPNATLVGDLASGRGLPSAAFDCIILTQVLPFIFDLRPALQHLYESLRPGGVVLATLPGISQISRYDMERWGDFWRFTNASAQRLFSEVFGTQQVQVRTHGNVLVAAAFLHGLAAHELSAAELEHHDADYQVLITVRAVRKAGEPA